MAKGRIYKYVGSSYLADVLNAVDSITLKCGYPRDFNDPFELFPTVDFTDVVDAIAYYGEAIGSLPQLPTTCFSRTPVSLPMWAHYAEDLRGCVVEIDETALASAFPKAIVDDVTYQDEPYPGLTEMLHRAYEIMKPRYTYLLQRGVFAAAYLTKATSWSYEQECRMVLSADEVREAADLVLLDVPKDCVSALICGPRASRETSELVRGKANQFGCRYFDLAVGRSSAVPYFLSADRDPFAFSDEGLAEVEFACTACLEPLSAYSELCSWCAITDAHRETAARSNPFRMLADFGMLDSYIEGMDGISSGDGSLTEGDARDV